MPGEKMVVRSHLKPPGWDVPYCNLLQRYFEACEQLQVCANTGVANQLLRRARMLQALPYHVTRGLSVPELLALMQRHLDVTGQGRVRLDRLLGACTALNPRCDLAQALGSPSWLTKPPLSEVGLGEYEAAVSAAVSGLSRDDVEGGVLEVIAFQDQIEALGREGALKAAFREMDVTGEGSVPVSEVQALLGRIHPKADVQGLAEQHPSLVDHHGNMVSEESYLDLMSAACADLTDQQIIAGVYEVLDFKVRSRHAYDFSRCYLGDRGVLPLISALRADPTFTSLNLGSCGISSGGVAALVGLLAPHPAITALDLSNNPISDEGGVMLTQLLRDNPRIVALNIEGTYLLRGHSRTHHDCLGPSACEDGLPLLAALSDNQQQRRPSAEEVVSQLRDHHVDLKALMYGLADAKGKVSLAGLQSVLLEEAPAWGCDPEALNEVVHSDRLLGTETEGRTADQSSTLRVSFPEFMHFLRSEDLTLRVCHATRHHRLEVKKLFYNLMGPDTKASLSALRDAVAEVACQPGSGWNVSLADITATYQPSTFVPYLDISTFDANLDCSDIKLTWTQFFETVLQLYNR